MPSLIPRAVLLFDIDGVIRDVGGSYRRAIVETVHHYSGRRPDPSEIDALKAEGCWNNDWEASLELLRRQQGRGGAQASRAARPASGGPAAGGSAATALPAAAASARSSEGESSDALAGMPGAPAPVPPAADPVASDPLASDPLHLQTPPGDPKPPAAEQGPAAAGPSLPGDASSAESPSRLPTLEELVAVFGGFYFGGDPEGDPSLWTGYIGSEPLLVESGLFRELSAAGIAWGFVSGAEPPSVRYVLEQRLGLVDPPRIAMGEAPDKPDPTGFLRLAERLLAESGCPGLGASAPPVAYLGDTVADVITVQRARQLWPAQRFLSLAVAPPHLRGLEAAGRRGPYEAQLRAAGADAVLPAPDQVLAALLAAIA